MTRAGRPPNQRADRLTEKQLALVNVFLGRSHCCAGKAARMCASKSASACWQQGYPMMKNPAVRAAIEECLEQQREEFELRSQLQ